MFIHMYMSMHDVHVHATCIYKGMYIQKYAYARKFIQARLLHDE